MTDPLKNKERRFRCYNCNKINTYRIENYIDEKELFLDADGESSKKIKDIILSCWNCKKQNKISIDIFS